MGVSLIWWKKTVRLTVVVILKYRNGIQQTSTRRCFTFLLCLSREISAMRYILMSFDGARKSEFSWRLFQALILLLWANFLFWNPRTKLFCNAKLKATTNQWSTAQNDSKNLEPMNLAQDDIWNFLRQLFPSLLCSRLQSTRLLLRTRVKISQIPLSWTSYLYHLQSAWNSLEVLLAFRVGSMFHTFQSPSTVVEVFLSFQVGSLIVREL